MSALPYQPSPMFCPYFSGTTYSCVGVYHAVTGNVDILETQEKHQCIPSVVAFRYLYFYYLRNNLFIHV